MAWMFTATSSEPSAAPKANSASASVTGVVAMTSGGSRTLRASPLTITTGLLP